MLRSASRETKIFRKTYKENKSYKYHFPKHIKKNDVKDLQVESIREQQYITLYIRSSNKKNGTHNILNNSIT